MEKQTRQTNIVCTTKKGSVWDTTGGTPIQKTPIQYPYRLGIQTQ